MRRHWTTTLLAYLCFITAAALLYSLCLLPLKTGAAGNAPLYTAMWRILGLFPSPTSISWAIRFLVGSASPALLQSKIYSGVLSALVLVFSLVLGIAILQLWPWARWALVAICVLTLALDAYSVVQLIRYSPGILAVLTSNYRGATAGYVSGVGPGAALASIAISVAFLRLLLRHGLPAISAVHSKPISLSGSVLQATAEETKLQRANKLVLAGTGASLLLQLVFLIGIGVSGESGSGMTRLLLCAMMAPCVLILIRSWRGADRLSLGLATGYGVLISYMGAIFLPVFLFGLLWITAGPRHEDNWLFVLLEVVPLVQFFVLVAAIVATRHLAPARTKAAGIGIWGAAFLVPVILGTAGPQFYFDWQQGRMRVPGVKSGGDELQDLKNQQRAAWDLVRVYGKCAFLYSKSHPESGFPKNAAEMGPGGTACLTKTEAAGAPEGYSFRYAAEKSEGAAGYDRFSTATQLNMQYHYDAALMDEKGIYVLGQSAVEQKSMVSADQISWDSPGMYKRPWNVTAWTLPRIQVCSNLLRKESAGSEYSSTLAAILSVKEKPNDPDCLKLFGSTPDLLLQAAANSNRVEDHGYILDYEPSRDASSKIVHFGVSLRPKTFGEDGVRSYFMDESGVIHATSENRPATSVDPVAMACESVLGEVCQDTLAKQ
jgi:hypothetical protein